MSACIDHNYTPARRRGERPVTTKNPPHSQVDQLPLHETRDVLCGFIVSEVMKLPDVVTASSRRAPPGTVGFYLEPDVASADERRFLLGTEFAHVHVCDDGSLHAILPEPLRTSAIAAGWAEAHPFAGQPTVSPDTVLIYAPRDREEAEVVVALVRQSWAKAKA